MTFPSPGRVHGNAGRVCKNIISVLIHLFSGGRLRNLYVYVSENSNNYTSSDLCARYPGQASSGEVIKLECCPSQRGRFVRLQTDYRAWDLGGEENVLTLCEVEVY